MTQQHLEGILTKSLKNIGVWHLKLQTNPLAHKDNPADYIVLTNNYNYLIECKESKSNRFDFDRLTQEKHLVEFQTYGDRFLSFVMILFWNNRALNSTCFMIPINMYLEAKKTIGKKSINLDDCLRIFPNQTVKFINSETLDISKVII
jgi:hypothetical protein